MSLSKPIRGTLLNKSHPLARGLVAYWLMNEGCGSQIFDLSGNKNTGIFSGDTSWTAGKFGPCLSFDGTGDHVDFGDINAMDGLSAITFSCWYKHAATPNGGYVFSKFDTGAAETANWAFWIDISAQYESLFIILYDSLSSGHYCGYEYVVIDYKWHHVVGRYDGNYIRMWRDGVEVGNPNAMTGNTLSSAAKVRIGDSSNNADAFAGLIDMPMVFNRALSNSEIKLLYRNPFCIFEPKVSPALMGDFWASDVTVTPEALGLGLTLQTPTVLGDALIISDAFNLGLTLQSPTILTGVVVMPATLQLGMTIQTPTVTGGALMTPAALNLGLTLEMPDIISDITILPAALASGLHIWDPKIDMGSGLKAKVSGERVGSYSTGKSISKSRINL